MKEEINLNKITTKESLLLDEMIEQLDLPKSIEEKVRQRYYSLGEWFNRKECTIKDVDIFVQGSFGQGTTIKPLTENEEYDLDMSCKININNYKRKCTQAELMKLVRYELELYRKNVGIQSEIEEKKRCLRLVYKDEVSFHLDFVPSIPLEEGREYNSSLLKHYQENEKFASDLAMYAVNIPDKENKNYNEISDDWHISNQQGYLLWFQNKIVLDKQKVIKSSIEPIPNYKGKSVLQRCIQLLKRHRDTMFSDEENKDKKPISIIITTLAARAYKGEQKIEEAIINILNDMQNYINGSMPRIPNPVKPEEDFTDRWDNPKYTHLELETNFYLWLCQAKADFSRVISEKHTKEMSSLLSKGFALDLSEETLKTSFGYKESSPQKTQISKPSTKPWINS